MDKIVDFSNCKRAHVTYGGSDRKFGVIYNDEIYMLKFSEKHAKRTDISTSYVNNAISEYISSHIAQSTGLPVHDTVLGTFNDEIVVGCKDFRNKNDSTNIEFSEYVRAKYDSSEINRSIMLNQIYDTLRDPQNDIPKMLQKESIERYWDTFVIDALVGNFDRHAGNWGYLFENGNLKLAPIYDFGSSLLPRISDDGAELLLNNQTEMIKRCLVFPSPSLFVTNEKVGKVGYYDMLSSNYDSNCTKAVLRMAPKIDMPKIHDIVDNTPLISSSRKIFYKNLIDMRNELIIARSYVRCFLNEFDNDAKERLQTGHQFSENDLNHFVNERRDAEQNFKSNEMFLEHYTYIDNDGIPLYVRNNATDVYESLLMEQKEYMEEFGFSSKYVFDNLDDIKRICVNFEHDNTQDLDYDLY